MFIDKLYESILVGGWILLPIFLVGAWAFYLLFSIASYIGEDILRNTMDQPLDWFRQSLLKKSEPPGRWWGKRGLSYALLDYLLSLRHEGPAFREAAIHIRLSQTSQRMVRGLGFVGVLASVAPLLGLLGTVDGMVNTFQIITEYGNSNPVLLAEGISEALLTTQSGLVIAFPLLLLKNFFDDRIDFITKQLERVTLKALNIMEKK